MRVKYTCIYVRSIKRSHLYPRGGYILNECRLSVDAAVAEGKSKKIGKKNRSSVGVKTPLAGMKKKKTKKKYIIRVTNRNRRYSVIRRALRKCVESLTRCLRLFRPDNILYDISMCVENGTQLFGTLFSVNDDGHGGGSIGVYNSG